MRVFSVALLCSIACSPSSSVLDVQEDDPTAFGVAVQNLRTGAEESWGPTTTAERVWDITEDWASITPEAGLAWSANSGLDWDAKYRVWIDDLESIQSDDLHQTAALTTPWGRTLPLNRLECAESALVLRATFAAWHGLPFFVSAYSPVLGQNVHYGHFGMVTGGGSTVSWQPSFGNFVDHSDAFEGMPASQVLANWPDDATLEGMALTAQQDDVNAFLGANQFSGAYFDEIHLNKKVGRFLLALLTDFGSIHLAHSTNLFDLAPEAIEPGDVLVHRWQAQGIGHTMVIKEVIDHGNGTAAVNLLAGSMPRVQPRWNNDAISKSYFFSRYAGSDEISAATGEAYVTFGGGLKRWRSAVRQSGAWVNHVPVIDRPEFIDPSDTAGLTGRLDTFEVFLGDLTPEDERDSLLEAIAVSRESLAVHPSSCANRERREQSFDRLYAVMQDDFGWSRQRTDATYRELDDYVFAELEYTASPSCCWNSSNAEMYGVVMDLVEEELGNAAASGQCAEPRVFHMENGGYAEFAAYAAATGRGWVAWSADESCPQANATDDVIISEPFTDWCALDAVCLPVAEVCDGVDNDCDGIVDEGCTVVDDPPDDPPDSGSGGCGSSMNPQYLLMALGGLVFRARRERD